MTTERKLLRVTRGTSIAALRVLEAVPISEPWTREQIVSELRRSGGGADTRHVHGCLGSLRDAGLIKEPKVGHFIRVKARPRTTSNDLELDNEDAMAEAKKMEPAKSAEATTAPPCAVTALGEIASSMRKIASDIEDVALGIQQQMDAIKADGAKLQQLRELLKGIA